MTLAPRNRGMIRFTPPGVALLLALSCGGPREVHEVKRFSDADATGSVPSAVDQAAQSEELNAILGLACPQPSGSLVGYGTRDVNVSSRAYWTSAGLYLRRGESVGITATGSWTVWKGVTAPFGPEGHPQLTPFSGCPKGALVARVGLALGGPRQCVGANGVVTAEQDGLLYLAMNDGAANVYHDGEVVATIDAPAGLPAPTVPLASVPATKFCEAASGWVELASDSFVLTVPAALAGYQRDGIAPALSRLEEIYALHEELAGGAPFEGEPLRLYPDFSVRDRGWMVAGNPLVYDPKSLNGAFPSETKILRLGDEGAALFDLVRAIGVTFSRVRGARYQAGDAGAQAWGGLFALYTMRKLPLGRLPQEVCAGRDAHLAGGTQAQFLADPWLQLCLLSDLAEKHGWALHQQFLASLPTAKADWDAALPSGATAAATWAFVRARYAKLGGAEADALFATYKSP